MRHLGSLGGNILGVPMGGLFDSEGSYGAVSNPVPVVPAACWDKPNFKACQSWAISSPHADCQALAKAGNWPQAELDKCIEDKYRYRMTNNCIATCASGTVTYPGMTSGATAVPGAMTTLELQNMLNTMLKPAGYITLDPDGKLGAKTCGAAKQFTPGLVPAECATKGYTAPTKASSGGGGGSGGGSGGGVIVAATTVKAPTSIIPTTNAGMLSSAKWLIGSSLAIALGLVGVAIAQKKGLIKGHGGPAKK
jgi:hypothetical protein